MMTPKKNQDAIALLTEHHREVEKLFERYEKAQPGTKQKLAGQICDELKIHTMIEEEIFYPALEGKVEDDDLKEAYVEHDGAKVLVNDILSEDRDDDEYYDAKVKVLQEQVAHHIEEEEKGGDSIFGQAKKADVDLDELGSQMAERMKALQEKAKAGGLPPASSTAVTPMPL
jgi:hypothetical protein